jgi:hypothetical protein
MLTDTEASTFALLEKFGIFSSPIEKEADQLLEHLANAELKDPSCTL